MGIAQWEGVEADTTKSWPHGECVEGLQVLLSANDLLKVQQLHPPWVPLNSWVREERSATQLIGLVGKCGENNLMQVLLSANDLLWFLETTPPRVLPSLWVRLERSTTQLTVHVNDMCE